MTAAEMFMKYDYAEMKDLLKTFITLISATIVLSLTFSDKIIKYETAQIVQKRLLIIAWSFMIASLVLAGVSLVLIASAAGKLLYGSIPFLDWNYWTLTQLSVAAGLAAGASYVAGLVVLMMAVLKTPPAPSYAEGSSGAPASSAPQPPVVQKS